MDGPFVLNKYVEETYVVTPSRSSEEHKQFNEEADEKLAAYMYVLNSDQVKSSTDRPGGKTSDR